jgi:hypothetical protein
MPRCVIAAVNATTSAVLNGALAPRPRYPLRLPSHGIPLAMPGCRRIRLQRQRGGGRQENAYDAK